MLNRRQRQMCIRDRGFALVSRLSYALYLVHYPLIPFALFCSHEAGSSLLVFWTVYLATSFLVAWVLHRYVEKPCLEIRDRWLVRGQPGGAMVRLEARAKQA